MHVMPETLYGLLPPAIEPAMATGVTLVACIFQLLHIHAEPQCSFPAHDKSSALIQRDTTRRNAGLLVSCEKRFQENCLENSICIWYPQKLIIFGAGLSNFTWL